MSAYEAILRTLNDSDQHKLVSPDGLANAALRDATGLQDSAVISRALWRMEQDGLVKRDVRGRRCFAISLTRTGVVRATELGPPDAPATSKGSSSKTSSSKTSSSRTSSSKASSKAELKRAPKTQKSAATPAATSDDHEPLTSASSTKRALSSEADAILNLLAATPNQRITDVDGRMNSILRQRLAINDPLAVTRALTVLEKRGLIHRVLHGKRCPLLELTDTGRAHLGIEVNVPSAVQTSVTAAVEEPPAQSPSIEAGVERVAGSATEPAVDVEFATAVANQLLTLVLSKTNANEDSAREVSAIRAELERTVEACEEAEQRAAASNRELALLRAELQTWKDRCDRLEKNLDAVMNGPDRSRAAYDRARELSKIISARPNSGGR